MTIEEVDLLGDGSEDDPYRPDTTETEWTCTGVDTGTRKATIEHH